MRAEQKFAVGKVRARSRNKKRRYTKGSGSGGSGGGAVGGRRQKKPKFELINLLGNSPLFGGGGQASSSDVHRERYSKAMDYYEKAKARPADDDPLKDRKRGGFFFFLCLGERVEFDVPAGTLL